jgi:hypothetical protein
MKANRDNWKEVKGIVVKKCKKMPCLKMEAAEDEDERTMKRKHDAELFAYNSEARRPELVKMADLPEGTEARKVLRKMQTFTTKPQSIPSNDYSMKISQRRAKVEEYNERGERTCRPSSKTDIRINSYFRSKSSTPKGVK